MRDEVEGSRYVTRPSLLCLTIPYFKNQCWSINGQLLVPNLVDLQLVINLGAVFLTVMLILWSSSLRDARSVLSCIAEDGFFNTLKYI